MGFAIQMNCMPAISHRAYQFPCLRQFRLIPRVARTSDTDQMLDGKSQREKSW